MEPSSIIGAGVAAVVATGIAGQAALPVAGAIGVGGLGAAGALGMREAMEMMRGTPMCTNRQCVVGNILNYFTEQSKTFVLIYIINTKIKIQVRGRCCPVVCRRGRCSCPPC